MAKVLYGTVAPVSQLQLLDEIRALRQRVAELEAALADATEVATARADLQVIVDEATAGVGA